MAAAACCTASGWRRSSRRCGVALLGGIVERLLLRHMYGREELYQLLFTYALVLILGDAAKAIWGTQQLSVSRPPMLAGGIEISAPRCRPTTCSSC